MTWEYAFLERKQEIETVLRPSGEYLGMRPWPPTYHYQNNMWTKFDEACAYLGRQGWEYMGDSPSGFVFKRPIEHQSETTIRYDDQPAQSNLAIDATIARSMGQW